MRTNSPLLPGGWDGTLPAWRQFLWEFMRIEVCVRLVAAALVGGMLGVHGATFTINPAVVTNDFASTISLAIAGVPAGADVIVERYADANHNGVIDPGEPVMQAFKVKDGVVPTIGGVRNWNVPGDEDGATNGQLSVQLLFPGVDVTLGRFEGNYLYRISSPTGAFAPVTQPFKVWQKPTAQGLRGRITDAATGAPLTNAAVVLLSGGGKGNSVGGTLINSNGYFALFTAPSNYMFWVVQDGYVGDAAAGMATVIAGQFTTANAALVAGTNIVTGRLTDATNGTGLPGVAILAQSSDNHYALTFTDTNGVFLLKLISGQWHLGYNSSQLPLLGHVGLQGDLSFTVSGNVSNLNLQVPKANALIYGIVTNGQGNPMSGIDLYASDSLNLFQADGASSPPEGAYCLGVLAGAWNPGPDNDQLAGLGYVSQGTNVTLSAGQAVRADFVLRQVSAHLVGRVLDEFGNPVDFVTLGVNGNNGPWISSQTDGNGNFDLGVTAGTWQFSLNDSDAQQRGLMGSSFSVTVTDGQTLTNIIYLVRHVTGQITGNVSDNHGSPVGQLGVWANATINGANYSAYVQTDNGGNYQLSVGNGNWSVGLDCNGLQSRGYNCPNSQNVTVSGNSPTVNFTVSSGSPLQILTTTLGNGTAGAYYQVLLQATGGQQPYQWSLAPGSAALPANLTLGSDGTLSGTSSVSGNFAFIVRVTDNTGATADQTLFLAVTSGPLQVTTTALPNAVGGVSYGAQLEASGGQQPYSWSLALGSAPLPVGLTLQTNGWLAGAPTAAGTNTFIVRVTDAAAASAQQVLSLAVLAPPTARLLAPTLLPNGAFGFTVSGTAGRRFDIYASPDLRNWAMLYSTNPPGGVFQVSGPIPAGYPSLFFRVQVR